MRPGRARREPSRAARPVLQMLTRAAHYNRIVTNLMLQLQLEQKHGTEYTSLLCRHAAKIAVKSY